jgi:cephalosporin-C deacetylase-like acetyl esterase
LIPPATAHDILEDIKDVFAFVSRDLNAVLDANLSTDKFHVDGSALAVAGSSAGGLCAYLAAMHAEPRPRAVLCIYPMLGDGLVCLIFEYLVSIIRFILKSTTLYRLHII